MTIKDCKKGLKDIKQVMSTYYIKLDDSNYAIYKINNEGELIPFNKAANGFITPNRPIDEFNRIMDKALKELEEPVQQNF